jgi:hypothetical protein
MAKTKSKAPPDTIITLTLPGTGGITRIATLVARRGDLAAIKQFQYASLNDLALAIRAITVNLNSLELNPPSLPQPAPAHSIPLISRMTPDTDDIDEDVEDNKTETEDLAPEMAAETATEDEWAATSTEEPAEAATDPLNFYEDLAPELLDPANPDARANAGYDRDMEFKSHELDTPPTHLPPGSATQQLEMF